MWLQDGEVGNALFCLEKQGVQYYCFAEKWTDKILYDKDNTYPNNTVIELDYTAKLESEEYLSDDSPFFFSDVDFDGEDEFVINRYKSGSRESNAYDVYDVTPYGYFIRKTEAPLQSWKTDNVSLIQRTRPLQFLVLMAGTILSIRPIN